MFPNPNLVGVDINNVLAVLPSNAWQNYEYTATEDCIVFYQVSGSSSATATIKIDGKLIGNPIPNSFDSGNCIVLKKGQKIEFYATYWVSTSSNIYGLKYI